MTSKKHNFSIFAKIISMKKSIVHNLSWLLVCSILAKVIGGVYRIFLTRILGTDIGLYQLVFSAYSFFVILTSSGVPLAISKLVSSAKSDKARQSIVYQAIGWLVGFSLVLTVLLMFGSKGLALLQGHGNIYVCYIILAPSLVLSASAAILKGYYQGLNDFKYPAIANILEQFVRVVSGIVFMLLLRRYFLLGALIGAMIGSLIGDLICFMFLYLMIKGKVVFKFNFSETKRAKMILRYVYPIMLYSLIVPFTNFIDSFLVVKLLNVNYSLNASTLLYGLQSGVVGSLVNMPNIFSFALASVLMPSLSADYLMYDKSKFNSKIKLAVKLAIWIALPCTVFIALNSGKIINLIYGEQLNGFGINGKNVATMLMMINSVVIVFSCLNQIFAVVLQNINKKVLPIISLGLGVVIKIIIELLLIPNKSISIYAFGIAVVSCFVVACVLNLIFVTNIVGNIIDIKYIVKQLVVLMCVSASIIFFANIGDYSSFVLGAMFSIIIYFILTILFKLFTKKDIKLLLKN